jgi:exodeoxyribonuclease V alpha subunit
MTAPAVLQLEPDQVEAVALALDPKRRVGIITGAPGTGKSHSVREIVDRLERAGLKVVLAAPTGKAAKRLREATGRLATTIHRMLGPTMDSRGRFVFMYGPHDPIPADVVILDEVSMVDVLLMQDVVEALAPHARLLLVGDQNQLPAVGPGAVLQDLLGSHRVPAVELTTIKRQNPGPLLRAIHAIKDGRCPKIENAPGDDLFLEMQADPADIVNSVLDLALARLPAKFARAGNPLDPLKDVQVIAPTRERGPLSCAVLNERFQAALWRREGVEGDSVAAGAGLFPSTDGGADGDGDDKESAKKRPRRRAFLAGDKVIQTKNDYSLGICNGDIGFVLDPDARDLDGKKVIRVAFDAIAGAGAGAANASAEAVEGNGNAPPREIDIPATDNHLELAYAVTCHKYQGSESRVVIIPIHSSQPSILMTRNWIYTALSRARELCILVGEERALAAAVRRVNPTRRTTALRLMVEEASP